MMLQTTTDSRSALLMIIGKTGKLTTSARVQLWCKINIRVFFLNVLKFCNRFLVAASFSCAVFTWLMISAYSFNVAANKLELQAINKIFNIRDAFSLID